MARMSLVSVVIYLCHHLVEGSVHCALLHMIHWQHV